jgi:citrate lyase subunit beta/citryl-CoA lyase
MSERTRELPRRSCLSVPASSEKMLAKAPGLAVDMVFADLEDSVAPLEKDAARPRAAAAIRDLDWGERIVCVRLNAWDTPWTHLDVIEIVGTAGERLDEVMLPKVESAAHVEALDLLLTQVEQRAGLPVGHIGIEAQIENARGLAAIDDICRASRRLEAIVLGPVDMSASLELPDLDGSGVPDEVLARLLVAGRAAGVQVIDGPCTRIRDLDALRSQCERSRRLGYDGKWVLHPDQVDIVNAAFSPDQEAFDRAVSVLGAYEAATTEGDRRGAVMFGDEMIDEASRKVAEKLVARGRRSGLTPTPT